MGISHSWNGTVLTITSDSGTSSADLKGEMGIRGPQGIPGEQFKPEKGVDYFTEEELLALKEAVTAEVNTHVDAEVEAASGELARYVDQKTQEASATLANYVDGKAAEASNSLTAYVDAEVTEARNNLTAYVDAEMEGVKPADWMPTASEVGAAPSGYGLGTQAPDATDLNTCTMCGWYNFGKECANAPFTYGVLEVINRSGMEYVQIAYDTALDKADHNGAIAKRVKGNSATEWGEWEFENPPMLVGVEYRTTERWGGKAVYTRLGSYTFAETLGDASTVSIGYVSFGTIYAAQILSAEIVRNTPTETDRGYIVPTTAATGALLSVNSVLNNGLVVLIANKYTVPAGSVMYCTLRYTKD